MLDFVACSAWQIANWFAVKLESNRSQNHDLGFSQEKILEK
jgi:hypothetical protein